MNGWTDYPLCESSVVSGPVLDKPGRKAPIREVELLGWDGNKYCLVKFEEGYYNFKLAYVHTEPGCRASFWDERHNIPIIEVWEVPGGNQ
jgi:hypothetical protein